MNRRAVVDRALLAVVTLGGALLTYLALTTAPSFVGRPGFTAPLSWKLFFFHVPIALATFLAFSVALAYSLHYLWQRAQASDHAAHAAIEVGVVLAALTLLTGMVWGKAEWGTPWRWADAKLTVVLVMFLLYAAYLFLRQQIPDPEPRARISALYATIGFASVPLAWFAQRIWLSFHPTVFGPQTADAGIVSAGVWPLFLLGLLVFGAAFAYLFRWRRQQLDQAALADQLETAEALLP